MIHVALAGLLGRKLRTVLTALAIVLGVAMVSGTLVLTDSIDKAFNFIYTDVRQGSDAVISGKSAIGSVQRGQGTFAPTVPGVAAGQGPCAARRLGGGGQRQRRGAADRSERQGDRLRRRAEPRLQHLRAGLSRSTPLMLSPALGRRRRRGRDRQAAPRTRSTSRSAIRRGQAEGPVAAVPHLRASSSSAGVSRSAARRWRLRSPDRAEALRQARALRRDRRRPQAGRHRRAAASAEISRFCRRPRRCEPAPPRPRGRASRPTRSSLPARLPARVRRHRAVRRQLRDRQLAVDHDRPAHARVRDAADARARAAGRC